MPDGCIVDIGRLRSLFAFSFRDTHRKAYSTIPSNTSLSAMAARAEWNRRGFNRIFNTPEIVLTVYSYGLVPRINSEAELEGESTSTTSSGAPSKTGVPSASRQRS
jgi:hypothetical protein